jgi:hypothetical protein
MSGAVGVLVHPRPRQTRSGEQHCTCHRSREEIPSGTNNAREGIHFPQNGKRAFKEIHGNAA